MISKLDAFPLLQPKVMNLNTTFLGENVGAYLSPVQKPCAGALKHFP